LEIFTQINNINIKNNENNNVVSKTLQNNNKLIKINNLLKINNNTKNKKLIKNEIENLIKELNKELDKLNTSVKFKYLNKLENFIVQVIDTKNNKVIGELPPKDIQKLQIKLKELTGLLFDKKF